MDYKCSPGRVPVQSNIQHFRLQQIPSKSVLFPIRSLKSSLSHSISQPSQSEPPIELLSMTKNPTRSTLTEISKTIIAESKRLSISNQFVELYLGINRIYG